MLRKLAALLGGRSDPPHPLCPGNPGVGTIVAVSPSKSGPAHVVRIAERVLRLAGHRVVNHGAWLSHPASGITLQPQSVEVARAARDGFAIVSTVQSNHPLFPPAGIFEYQHATGDTLEDAFSSGFEQWVNVDFVTMLDAVDTTAKTCTTLEWRFPKSPTAGAEERVRRIVLGPIAHFQQQPPAADAPQEEHPFCPCCLFTRNFEAFRALVEGQGFCAVRLYALREADGTAGADCRVNGEDYADGMRQLSSYVGTWPGEGFEFRKQYIVIQDPPDASKLLAGLTEANLHREVKTFGPVGREEW